MNRNLAVALGVIVLAVAAVVLGTRDTGPPEGCDAVQQAVTIVEDLRGSREFPTADRYAEAGRAVRASAVAAPGEVAPEVHALADAYGQLGILFQGFDPEDPATYPVIEVRTPDIEREEARVEESAQQVSAWFRERCAG